MTDEDFIIKQHNVLEKAANELMEARMLLHECLFFMNNVPNNKYSTIKGNEDHYELCSRISKLLK